jgi:hypothetical protein
MAIEFLCPACRGTLSMPDDSAGKLVRCGNCLATLRVPDAPPAPSYEPTPRPRPVQPVRESRPDRDEHGEPRPRRKSKPNGRGALFWILIVLVVLGLFTCLACGGVWAMLAQPRWQKMEPANAGYSAEFPAPRNPNIAREAQLELGQGEQVDGTMLVGRLELYWVWYSPLQGQWRKAIGDEALLDQAEKSMEKDGKGRIVKTVARTVDGQSARELVIASNEGEGHYHCLIVIGKDKLYIAVAGGLFTKAEGNARVRRFLDSFHLK